METLEYCPRCRMLVRASLTEARQRRISPEGVCREVLVRTIHCTNCRGFLRSEDIPLPKPEEQDNPNA